jgi:hypothetical protein
VIAALQGAADPANAGRAWPGIEHGDIRFDEDYARFYEAYSGQRKLPPPVEGRTLYSELGLLQQKQQLLAQQQGMMGSATPPPTQALLMGGGLTPGGEQRGAVVLGAKTCAGRVSQDPQRAAAVSGHAAGAAARADRRSVAGVAGARAHMHGASQATAAGADAP